MKTPAILIILSPNALDKYLVLPNSTPIILGRIYLTWPAGTPHAGLQVEQDQHIREISSVIGKALDRYQPESWGLASEEPYADELVMNLGFHHKLTMFKFLRIPGKTVNIGNVVDVFSCEIPEGESSGALKIAG